MAAGAFADDLVAALQAQGLVVEQYYPELGHGQHELSIRHAGALTAADNHLKLRETIRGVAMRTGCSPRWRPSRCPTRPATARTFTSACGTPRGAQCILRSRRRARPFAAARAFAAGVLTICPHWWRSPAPASTRTAGCSRAPGAARTRCAAR